MGCISHCSLKTSEMWNWFRLQCLVPSQAPEPWEQPYLALGDLGQRLPRSRCRERREQSLPSQRAAKGTEGEDSAGSGESHQVALGLLSEEAVFFLTALHLPGWQPEAGNSMAGMLWVRLVAMATGGE